MSIRVSSSSLAVGSVLAAVLLLTGRPTAQTSTGAHDYFNALVARGDHWRSYSFRDPAQLRTPRDGGLASSNSGGLWVTYDPDNDLDPQRQDAAKAIIPAFTSMTDQLVTSVGPTERFLSLSNAAGDITKVSTAYNSKGRQIRLGSEVLLATQWPEPCPATNPNCNPLDRTTGVLYVTRGALGTTAIGHPARTETFYIANNSLPNQVHVPLNTSNGNRYLFTWDTYHTDSYKNTGISNWKAFHFASNSLWLEPQTRTDGGGVGGANCFDPARHISSIEMRAYPSSGVDGPADWMQSNGNQMGPGTSNAIPIMPRANEFCHAAGTWVRWWVLIEQRANDYDYMSFWVADETRDAVLLYDRIPLSVEPDSKPVTDSITEFWVELNTSDDKLAGTRVNDFRDLVVYVRNFVALINPPDDIRPLLSRPALGAALPPPLARPTAPRNLRVSE
ncbi:hypothetical protein [Luteitalea sp.]